MSSVLPGRATTQWTAALATAVALLTSACTATPAAPPLTSPGASAATITKLPPSATAAPATTASAAATVSAALAGWHLRRPLSRLVAAATPDGRVLLIGGLLPGDDTVATVERLDLRTGAETSAPPLVTGVHDAAVATTSSAALVFGGGAASEVSAVQQIAFTGGAPRVVGQLPQPRSDVTAVTSGATTYLVGGYDGRAQLPSVLATRDGRTFRRVADLAVPVRYTAAAVADGALWAFGGEHDGAAIDTVQRIDLRTGRVSRAGRLPQPLGEAVAITLGGHVLLAGGRDGSTVNRSVWEFDPVTVTFRRVARLPLAVAMPGVATVGDTAWLFGGETAGAHTTAVQTITAR